MKYNTFKLHLYNLFNNYSLIFLGLTMFSIFIFFKFLRVRLPRNIPFNLSVIGFFILIYICLIFGIIVWAYIRPAKNSNETLSLFIKFIFGPLDAFDTFIKQFYYIKTYYPKILIWIANNWLYIFKTPIFELIFFVIPRTLLITTFIIDVFYFSKLEYIYYVLVSCGLLLFIRRYFLYSINKLKLEIIEILKLDVQEIGTAYEKGIHPSELEPDYDPNDPDNMEESESMALDLDHYIKYYAESKVYKEYKPKIRALIMTLNFYNKHNAEVEANSKNKYEIHKKYKKLLTIRITEVLSLALLQEENNYFNNNKILKSIKVIIYTLYLISWLYILIISLHTLSIPKLITFVNSTWQTYPEPFSDVELFTIKKASYMKIIKFFGF